MKSKKNRIIFSIVIVLAALALLILTNKFFAGYAFIKYYSIIRGAVIGCAAIALAFINSKKFRER